MKIISVSKLSPGYLIECIIDIKPSWFERTFLKKESRQEILEFFYIKNGYFEHSFRHWTGLEEVNLDLWHLLLDEWRKYKLQKSILDNQA